MKFYVTLMICLLIGCSGPKPKNDDYDAVMHLLMLQGRVNTESCKMINDLERRITKLESLLSDTVHVPPSRVSGDTSWFDDRPYRTLVFSRKAKL